MSFNRKRSIGDTFSVFAKEKKEEDLTARYKSLKMDFADRLESLVNLLKMHRMVSDDELLLNTSSIDTSNNRNDYFIMLMVIQKFKDNLKTLALYPSHTPLQPDIAWEDLTTPDYILEVAHHYIDLMQNIADRFFAVQQEMSKSESTNLHRPVLG